MSKECATCSKNNSCQHNDDKEKLKHVLSQIKYKIVVLSGKGGVGKSSVAANLAAGLSNLGKTVGLLDVDVHGPSIPRLLNLLGVRPESGEKCLHPVSWGGNLKVMSIGFLLPKGDDAVIWRGPVKMGLIKQFLEDVVWGELDYLIVDCPPGTGDEAISVMQLLGRDAYGLIVTTPQQLSLDDVRRSIKFCERTQNPILGILENMSGFVCPHCNKPVDIFTSGGGENLAKEKGIPFLGKVPIDPVVSKAGDSGDLFVMEDNTTVSKIFRRIINKIVEMVEDKAID